MEGGKPENPEKNPRSNPHANHWNRTRVTEVGGECSPHYANFSSLKICETLVSVARNVAKRRIQNSGTLFPFQVQQSDHDLTDAL